MPLFPDVVDISSGSQEMHAEYVEANLLSQVRAVAPGQTICVWVGKSRTLVRFSIGAQPCEPAYSSR